MSINTYDVGDIARVAAPFTDENGAAVDPTTVTFKFKKPASAETEYVYPTDAELVKDSTGNYHVDLTLDTAGKWYYRWAGTGANVAADEGELTVQASHF